MPALPFSAASFDVALSAFGMMFAPDHAQAARELTRAMVAGDKIGRASWTPTGSIGQLFRCVGKYVPTAPGLASSILRGTEAHLSTLFGDCAPIEAAERRLFMFRYRSAEHFLDVFRRFYGPTHKAFSALDALGRAALASEMIALMEEHNRRKLRLGGAERVPRGRAPDCDLSARSGLPP